MIFFAAVVMNVPRPECEEAPFNPDLTEPGEKPDRDGVRGVTGSAPAVDDRNVRQHLGPPLTGFGLTSAAPRSL